MPHRFSNLIVGALSFGLAVAAWIQTDGLIATAPKGAPEPARTARNVDEILAPVPDLDLKPSTSVSFRAGAAPKAGSTIPLITVPRTGRAATETPAAPQERPKGIGPFGLIIPKNAERVPAAPAQPQSKGPPPTVGATKAAPLCVVDGVLIACGSSPQAD